MIILLRFIRGGCGFIFGLLVISAASSVVSFALQPGSTKVAATFFFALIPLLLFRALFFALRRLINYLHTKKHGVPHPALAKSNWAL